MSALGTARFAALLALAACHGAASEGPRASTDAAPGIAADAAAPVDPAWLVKNDCLSCHTEQMLEQQRLTPKQWAAVVKKMTGWGAPVEPEVAGDLALYLADRYGPDAGAYDPPSLPPSEAARALAPEDAGALPKGDATRGASLFRDRCAACHGADGRGQLGVCVVDRPLLDRPAAFAAVIRAGKGRMAPAAETTDQEIADLLAHLREARR